MPSGSSHRSRVRVIVLLVVAACAIALTYRALRPAPTRAGEIRASGTVEATEADVSPRVGGRLSVLRVDEGARVRKGQLLAVLDSPELADRVAQGEAALAAARSRLADLLAGARPETIRDLQAGYARALANAQGSREVLSTTREAHAKRTELRAAVVAAETSVRTAQRVRDAASARRSLVRKGPRQEDVERLRAAVQQSHTLQANATQDLHRIVALHADGAVSAQQLDRARATLEAQAAATRSAEASLEAALTGARPEEIAEADAQLAQAEAALDGARRSLAVQRTAYADRLQARQALEAARTAARTSGAQVGSARAQLDLAMAGPTRDVIEAARSQVRQAAAALAEARTQSQQTRLYAPADGVVTVKYREVGEVLTPGGAVVRVADLSRVWLRVYVPLPDLGRVQIGQSATVRADSFPGKDYAGTVTSIREEAEFTPKNVQTAEERVKLVYGIRIDVDNRSGELKPGMPADAIIQARPRDPDRRVR